MKEIEFFTCGRTLKYNQRQRIVFFKQLALILSSGLSLLQGLELIEGRSDKNLRLVCARLRGCLERGAVLSEAMAEQKQFFSDLAIALAVVGEESGRLSEVLQELAGFYSKQEELRNILLKAALYPLFLLAFSVAMLCFFIGYVMPILGNVYLSLQVRPRGILALLLKMEESNAFTAEALMLLVLFIASIGVYCRKKLLQLFLQLPLVKEIYHMLLELRFCKLLALMLGSGVDITRAVGLCGSALGNNEQVRGCLALFNKRLQRGIDIGSAAAGCNRLFSPLTIELIAVGAATGYLPEMLEEAVRLGEQELYGRLDRLKELLAPGLLVIAAVLVGLVVCSIVEPLFSLVGQIS